MIIQYEIELDFGCEHLEGGRWKTSKEALAFLNTFPKLSKASILKVKYVAIFKTRILFKKSIVNNYRRMERLGVI